jgi:hypothetical protein
MRFAGWGLSMEEIEECYQDLVDAGCVDAKHDEQGQWTAH